MTQNSLLLYNSALGAMGLGAFMCVAMPDELQRSLAFHEWGESYFNFLFFSAAAAGCVEELLGRPELPGTPSFDIQQIIIKGSLESPTCLPRFLQVHFELCDIFVYKPQFCTYNHGYWLPEKCRNFVSFSCVLRILECIHAATASYLLFFLSTPLYHRAV